MKTKKILKPIIIILLICLAVGAGSFFYNAYHGYNINSEFEALPLSYNPDDSTSTYNWNGLEVKVANGFVKGIQKTRAGETLVIRALSPLPVIEILATNDSAGTIVVVLENINPEFYAANIDAALNPARTTVNTLEFTINVSAGQNVQIIPQQPDVTEEDNYVILGDSRDGYETFAQMITQINDLNPVFVIDNGDLVYSGKPNQYRIFDQMVSKMSTTLCTTLGNHDIRGDGRQTYSMLYGPEYYSFDYGDNHFIFLDSSRGYAEMQAIPDEQYAWLESDLQKAQGKTIYVISHVPSTDPREGLKPNEIEAYTDQVKQEGGFVERKLEAYSEDNTIAHGFRDPAEAQKFEALMSQYQVKAVYLSHIHSYFDFTRDGVRYVISGGAGAELMTQNSYYHYLIAKLNGSDTLTMVQFPSPVNLLLARYGATVTLFSEAMYRENPLAVSLFVTGLVLLLILPLIKLVHKFKDTRLLLLIGDTGKFIAKRFKELFIKKD